MGNLTEKKFQILNYIRKQGTKRINQRQIAEELGYSLGTINAAIKSFRQANYINEGYQLQQAGWDALKPYKVTNAIIMAAGVTSRYEPLFNDMPKGLMLVKGEVLIERQIRQLQEAGIRDIYLVVGYKKELFFYLEDKYKIRLLINPDYALRNNNGTIYFVRKYLENSYICSSDDYFVENPFDLYNYCSYYAAEFMQGKTGERGVITGHHDQIVGTYPGAHNAWALIGHSYWNREFSKAFISKLTSIYSDAETKPLLWERIFDKYMKELPPMYLKKYQHVIYEFDSLSELRNFDPYFVDNFDKQIIHNICDYLSCDQEKLQDFKVLSAGQSNNLFIFTYQNQNYVYRNCSPFLKRVVNRQQEADVQELVTQRGIDCSSLYLDPVDGWKLARYLKTDPILLTDKAQLKQAVELVKQLHQLESKHSYNLRNEIQKMHYLLDGVSDVYENFAQELSESIQQLLACVEADHWKQALCHNNISHENFLNSQGHLSLIDWESAGMNDPGYDLAGLALESGNLQEVLTLYYGRPGTVAEQRHVYACVAILEYYRMNLAIYLEFNGRNLQDRMYYWYKNAKKYGKLALELYKEKEENDFN